MENTTHAMLTGRSASAFLTYVAEPDVERDCKPGPTSDLFRSLVREHYSVFIVLSEAHIKSSVRSREVFPMMCFRCGRLLGLTAPIILAIVVYAAEPLQNTVSAAHVHDTQRATARPVSAEGLPGLAEVSPTLYRGGQPSAAGFQTLARMGFEIVVDARGGTRHDEREEVNRLGMHYVSIPWHCPFPKDRVFARFLGLIRANPGKKIFVHCRLGDDRVGMMIAAYRMAEEGWTAQQAMEEMKASGFRFSHHFICPCLARYEKSFPQRYKTHPAFRSLQ